MNVTLLAHLLLCAVQQSIDTLCPPVPRQQTRRTLLQRSIAGVYIQTDRRTDIVPLHTVRAVSITRVVATQSGEERSDNEASHRHCNLHLQSAALGIR